jgi:hypothetical protein
MERENRYVVIKIADIDAMKEAGWPHKKVEAHLENALDRIKIFHEEIGKQPQNYVVVGEDWPMYEATWRAIENWVDGVESKTNDLEGLDAIAMKAGHQIESLQSTITKLEAEKKVMRGALEFYADEKTYDSTDFYCKSDGEGGYYLKPIETDNGKRATKALTAVNQ